MKNYLLLIKDEFTSNPLVTPLQVLKSLFRSYLEKSDSFLVKRHHKFLVINLLTQIEKLDNKTEGLTEDSVMTDILNRFSHYIPLIRLKNSGDFANLLKAFFSIYPHCALASDLREHIAPVPYLLAPDIAMKFCITLLKDESNQKNPDTEIFEVACNILGRLIPLLTNNLKSMAINRLLEIWTSLSQEIIKIQALGVSGNLNMAEDPSITSARLKAHEAKIINELCYAFSATPDELERIYLSNRLLSEISKENDENDNTPIILKTFADNAALIPKKIKHKVIAHFASMVKDNFLQGIDNYLLAIEKLCVTCTKDEILIKLPLWMKEDFSNLIPVIAILIKTFKIDNSDILAQLESAIFTALSNGNLFILGDMDNLYDCISNYKDLDAVLKNLTRSKELSNDFIIQTLRIRARFWKNTFNDSNLKDIKTKLLAFKLNPDNDVATMCNVLKAYNENFRLQESIVDYLLESASKNTRFVNTVAASLRLLTENSQFIIKDKEYTEKFIEILNGKLLEKSVVCQEACLALVTMGAAVAASRLKTNIAEKLVALVQAEFVWQHALRAGMALYKIFTPEQLVEVTSHLINAFSATMTSEEKELICHFLEAAFDHIPLDLYDMFLEKSLKILAYQSEIIVFDKMLYTRNEIFIRDTADYLMNAPENKIKPYTINLLFIILDHHVNDLAKEDIRTKLLAVANEIVFDEDSINFNEIILAHLEPNKFSEKIIQSFNRSDSETSINDQQVAILNIYRQSLIIPQGNLKNRFQAYYSLAMDESNSGDFMQSHPKRSLTLLASVLDFNDDYSSGLNTTLTNELSPVEEFKADENAHQQLRIS